MHYLQYKQISKANTAVNTHTHTHTPTLPTTYTYVLMYEWALWCAWVRVIACFAIVVVVIYSKYRHMLVYEWIAG